MTVLGELEHAVMRTVWQQSRPVTVKEVHESLSGERDIAYTTVLTVLDRLAKKHVCRRELVGRAWAYEPAVSHADLHAEAIISIVESCPPGSRRRVLDRVHELAEERQLLAEE
jgi:predicted transcriptional regulator